MHDNHAPPLTLIRGEPKRRHQLHDTSGDDHPIALPTPVARGVYTMPCTQDGCAIVYAVDSKGERQAELLVSTVGAATGAREELESLLARIDPQPPLSLTTSSAS